jgi:hypothetical protein
MPAPNHSHFLASRQETVFSGILMSAFPNSGRSIVVNIEQN